MNSETMQRTTLKVVCRILEDAAFIFTDTLDKEFRPDPATWEAEGISLTFSGHDQGVVRIWIDHEFAKIAAVNMRGTDLSDEHAAQMGMDAVSEVLNIIVGNLLTELYGNEPVFDLGLPTAANAAQKTADCTSDHATWLSAEGKPIVIVVETGTGA